MISGCDFGDNIDLTDRQSIESKFQHPVLASNDWRFEEGEVSKIHLINIQPLDQIQNAQQGVLVFSADRMFEIAAEDYYRRLKERADDPGILWFGRGMNGLKVSIVELGPEGKAYDVEADAITGN
jgi:hypothetical protein